MPLYSYNDVKQNIPIVVVEGSGRCSDVFVFAFCHWTKVYNRSQEQHKDDNRRRHSSFEVADTSVCEEDKQLLCQIEEKKKQLSKISMLTKKQEGMLSTDQKRAFEKLEVDIDKLEHSSCKAVEEYYEQIFGE